MQSISLNSKILYIFYTTYILPGLVNEQITRCAILLIRLRVLLVEVWIIDFLGLFYCLVLIDKLVD